VLHRIAEQSHSIFNFGSRDTIVFSSRPIPGNESGISRMQSALLQQRASLDPELPCLVHTTARLRPLSLSLSLSLSKSLSLSQSLSLSLSLSQSLFKSLSLSLSLSL
jgi:hypothetical protein